MAAEKRPWSPRPPDEDNPTYRRLAGARVIGTESERPDVADLLVEDADLGGVVSGDGTLRRIELRRTRIRDSVCAAAMVQDVQLTDCQVTGSSLRFSTLQRVVFTECQLVGLDLYAARFDRVRFERCDLRQAVFSNATVQQLRIEDCNLLGVTGALALRGAVVDLDDLAALAPSIAVEAGLVIAAPEMPEVPED